MNLITTTVIATSLAIDSFTVSISLGLSTKKISKLQIIKAGIIFGFFQGGMTYIGWLTGTKLQIFITKIDHWIAFTLLVIIGGKMIYEALSQEEKKIKDSFSLKTLIILGIATSIDALAIGITFAFLDIDIILPSILIGTVTLITVPTGIFIGKKAGHLFDKRVEIIGGVILILIGTKILLEHLGYLSF